MSYKVSFFGQRKDEILPDDAGKELYDDYQKGELAEKVEIRNGLTVERRTIREIEYIPSLEETYAYSRNELQAFERDKLAPFLDDRGGLSVHGHLKFLESEGLIVLEVLNSPVKSYSDVRFGVLSHMVNEYKKMTEKLSQWLMYSGKKNYGQKQRDKELEAMAEAQQSN